ncbi:methyltransferase [Nonomuraea sp. NPDC050310]|uniref:methyltransferase n=1 Tax=Nonomuraea sp. NPDC050310 TaxID=3154935 RepID=UPI0033C8BB6B
MTGAEDERGRPSAWEAAWRVLAPATDLVTPMAVRVAATLGIADLLSAGPLPAAELARQSGADPEVLTWLLRHLTGRGVFAEPEPGVFALNEPAELLVSDHPAAMRAWLDLEGFGGRMDLAFTGLLHTTRTGEPAWETVFGAPIWTYLAQNPGMGASFDAAMATGAEYVADAAGAFDWTAVRHVVDVGGGTGGFLAHLLRTHPHLRGTLVDLPETAARGREHLAGLGDRCTVSGQSFFDPLPAGADVYVLRRVIHDWPDADAARILRRCAEAAGTASAADAAGRVLLIESPSTSDGDPAAFAEMCLRMLVIGGGRERTIEEFATLAASAGLELATTRRTPLGQIVLTLIPEPTRPSAVRGT